MTYHTICYQWNCICKLTQRHFSPVSLLSKAIFEPLEYTEIICRSFDITGMLKKGSEERKDEKTLCETFGGRLVYNENNNYELCQFCLCRVAAPGNYPINIRFESSRCLNTKLLISRIEYCRKEWHLRPINGLIKSLLIGRNERYWLYCEWFN